MKAGDDRSAVARGGGSSRRPGQTTTCGICGEEIETPARPISVSYVLCKYGLARKEFGAVIDMDAHWHDYAAHYAERHPDVELPARFW